MGALVETDAVLSAKRGLAYLRIALPSADARLKGLVSLADQAVVSAANFVTGVILARACAKEELGLYLLGLSLMLVALDIQTALLATPYMIHSPRLQAGALCRYSGATFVQQLILSGTFAAGLMVVSVILGLRGTGSKPLAQVLAALGCVIVLVASREFIRRVCFAHLRMTSALLLDTCVAVIQVGGVAVIAWTGHLSARRCYWIIGFACGVAVVGWLSTNHKDLDIVLRDIFGAANDNWQLGKWILVSGAVWTLLMNTYPWILNALHGAAATAVWGACLGVTASSNPLLQGMLNYMGPKLANSYADGGHDGLRRAMGKCNAMMGAVLLPVSVVLVLCGGMLVKVLYGHKYAGNGIVVAVLALGTVANAAAFSYSRALFALDRADVDFAINVAALVLSIGCGVPLVKWLGPLGAAYTLTAVNMGGAASRVLAFHAVTARRVVGQVESRQ
jgi:O-antigen/teichoic acid export membrane protein